MNANDPTTPIGDLPPDIEPTVRRGSAAAPPRGGGFAPGTLLAGRYRITSLLGRGGMGEVYRADDLRLGQPVALKFISGPSDSHSLEHVYHEVRIARQVSHPNVCRVHDVVESDGYCFIAMEYVDGEDLASLLHRIGRLPAAKATEVARDVAAGLAAAHERGIVHRDLKPANVMIDGNGRARVTDFGLASLAGSHDGRIAGTPAYMAPEQVAGLPATPHTDIYAFGLLLHELFTGERVYASTSFTDRSQRRSVRPRPVSESVKDADPVIDAIVGDCLAEDPEARPASARVVLARLPGGDAIDAALAAGDTPSPEMVAAAAETGHLSARAVTAAWITIVAALGIASWQSGNFAFAMMRKPPEVMIERAEEVVAAAGETSPQRDAVHWYAYDVGMRRSPAARLPFSQLSELHPGIMRFVARRSPQRMAPRSSVQAGNSVFIFQSGRVTEDDPPLEVPGSTIVTLDQNRALVDYRALPAGEAAAADWRPLLALTAIDMSTLVPAIPHGAAPVASDARAAWTAVFHGQPGRITIEAASLKGRPAWLHVVAGWETQDRAASHLNVTPVIGFVQLTTMIVTTIAAIVITRRSLRRGRSDRTGALRLALYLGAALFAAWLIGAHHAVEPESEARMFSAGVGEAVASALIIWVFYIALEPGVRRNWPRSLIGWTRLLAGRLRDPMVGREVLFGIAAGAAACQIFWLGAAILQRRNPSGVPLFIHAQTLDPFAAFVGDQLVGHVAAIEIAIGTAFLLLMFRTLFGRTGGLIAYVLLAAAYVLVSPGIAIYTALLAFVVIRLGLLTVAMSCATVNLMLNSPLTTDTGAWYWPRALVVILIVLIMAAWASRVATRQS